VRPHGHSHNDIQTLANLFARGNPVARWTVFCVAIPPLAGVFVEKKTVVEVSTDAKKRHHLDKRAAAIAAQAPGGELLSTQELAHWLGISEQWLELARYKGYGPPYLRLSPRMIRYRRDDVLEWLASRTNMSPRK
jgi:predicted DNA-binding transcriptional regulator AlpA